MSEPSASIWLLSICPHSDPHIVSLSNFERRNSTSATLELITLRYVSSISSGTYTSAKPQVDLGFHWWFGVSLMYLVSADVLHESRQKVTRELSLSAVLSLSRTSDDHTMVGILPAGRSRHGILWGCERHDFQGTRAAAPQFPQFPQSRPGSWRKRSVKMLFGSSRDPRSRYL